MELQKKKSQEEHTIESVPGTCNNQMGLLHSDKDSESEESELGGSGVG